MKPSLLDQLNFHHLGYFRAVARTGSVQAAAAELGLAPSTVSAQVQVLARQLREPLFEKHGRGLALTDTGRLALRYAEEIHGLGEELLKVLSGQASGRPVELIVGIADALPKLVVRELLRPALRLETPVRLVCREDKAVRLSAELALHELDLVLSDLPEPAGGRVHSHLLGESRIVFVAAPALARKLRRGFPRSLDGAPLLVPLPDSSLRRALDPWLRTHEIRPRIAGEFEDQALAKAFAQDGLGALPLPELIEGEASAQLGLERVGLARGLHERFYALTAERRIRHPAVEAIRSAARSELFAPRK
jgi:LysR family transcriptional activator of nhaA